MPFFRLSDIPRHSPRLLAGLAVLGGIWLALTPPEILTPEAARAASLSLVAIGLWATGVLPEHLTALIFFLAAMLFSVAPPDIIFSGFKAAAFWLILGGLVVGATVGATGLGKRLAGRLSVLFGTSYGGIIAGVVAMGFGLAFLMPSTMGRVLLLLPIVMALADRAGFQPGSRGRSGMVLAGALATFVPPFGILTASVPTMVMVGVSETQYGIAPVYGEYLLTHLPVLGLVKALVLWALVAFLFRDEPGERVEEEHPGAMSASEKRLALVLAVALGLWSTDFLHHVSPAWIALGAGLVCLLPGVGLLGPKAFNEKVNFASIFYVAGILGMGALVAESGLGKVIAEWLLSFIPMRPGSDAVNFAAVSGVTALLGLITTLPGAAAVISPMAGDIATATGLPVGTVLMMEVVGFSTLILPYQGPPMVVAVQLGSVRMRDAAYLTLLMTLVTVVVVWPLNYLWWLFLGLLG